MSYPNYKYEVLLTQAARSLGEPIGLGSVSGVYTLSTSGDKGVDFAPVLVNHIVRGFGVRYTATTPGLSEAGQAINLLIQNLASGSTASQVVSLRTNASDAFGDVLYTATLDQLVRPGERVFVNVPGIITGSGDFQAVIYVEVSPSVAGNALTSQVRSTTAS